MPEPANSALDDARKRARRRLVGAIVLALGAAVIVPLFLESDQKPLGPDVQVQIPAIDDAKFENRLTPPGKSAEKPTATDKTSIEKAPADKASGGGLAAPKSTGVITEPATTKAPALDTTPGKPSAEPSAATAKAAGESAAPATSPSAPSPPHAQQAPQPAPSATPPKAATARGDAAPKGAKESAKEPSKSSAQKDAAKQAEAKKAATKKAAEPEPATNLGTATLNTAPPALKSSGEFVVQVGAFADKTVATELAAKAGEQGYPVFLEPVATKRGPIQRVRVGPFATRAAADEAAAKLAVAGFTAVARPR